MPSDVTIVLDPTEKPAVRCFKKNAHIAFKVGTITLIFMAGLLPTMRDAIADCLSKSAKAKARKKTK